MPSSVSTRVTMVQRVSIWYLLPRKTRGSAARSGMVSTARMRSGPGGRGITRSPGSSAAIVTPPPRVRASWYAMPELPEGATLYLTDIRHFARVWVLSADEAEARLAELGLGPEPLEEAFTPAALAAALGKRKAPLKPTLLDQSRVAGLGNIYVDEAL